MTAILLAFAGLSCLIVAEAIRGVEQWKHAEVRHGR